MQYPKPLSFLAAFLTSSLVATSALADDPPAPLPPPAPPPLGESAAPAAPPEPPASPPVNVEGARGDEAPRRAPPPATSAARTSSTTSHGWLQIGVRTGMKAPFGSLWRGPQGHEAMRDHFSLQVPVMLELSARVTKNLYLGVYGELSMGSTPGVSSAECDRARSGCQTASVRAGIQLQHHFAPSGKVDPWLGAAIGYEAAASQGVAGGRWQTTSAGGWEVLRAMGGVDFRVSKAFAIGPFMDVSASTYTLLERRTPSGATFDDWVPDSQTRPHGWAVIGVRGVLFP